MKEITADQKEKDTLIEGKVEEMGVFFEQSGMPPMVGRVIAYLLLCEPPHKDFFEIQNFLKASKSAVSTALNSLMSVNIVEYITFSGDRRRYFRIRPQGMIDAQKERLRKTSALTKWLSEALVLRSNSEFKTFNDELAKAVEFSVFLNTELERSIARWEEMQGK